MRTDGWECVDIRGRSEKHSELRPSAEVKAGFRRHGYFEGTY